MRKYVVELTEEQRAELLELTRKGECKARKLERAMVLLAADDGDRDEEIAGELRTGVRTVERTRRRFVEEGLEAVLAERPRPGAERKLDGRQEARLLALACSEPPDGRAKWTMRLLADRLVELGVVGEISGETVRRIVKRGT